MRARQSFNLTAFVACCAHGVCFRAVNDPLLDVLGYAMALQEHKVEGSEVHMFDGGGHGYAMCIGQKPPRRASACSWPQLAAAWMLRAGYTR